MGSTCSEDPLLGVGLAQEERGQEEVVEGGEARGGLGQAGARRLDAAGAGGGVAGAF